MKFTQGGKAHPVHQIDPPLLNLCAYFKGWLLILKNEESCPKLLFE